MAARSDDACLVTLVDRGREFAGHAEVAAVYDALNRRPRLRLGFRTPLEVHCSEVLHLL